MQRPRPFPSFPLLRNFGPKSRPKKQYSAFYGCPTIIRPPEGQLGRPRRPRNQAFICLLAGHSTTCGFMMPSQQNVANVNVGIKNSFNEICIRIRI